MDFCFQNCQSRFVVRFRSRVRVLVPRRIVRILTARIVIRHCLGFECYSWNLYPRVSLAFGHEGTL